MAARPAQRFSPIQNTTVLYRRSDYNEAEAANDNEGYSANDNQPTGPLTDIASGFNQQSYQQNYSKPVERAATTVRRTGTTSQVVGKTTVVAGKGAEIGGRALQRGGSAMVRAGVALSGTGIGAIAGVPLAIAGGATAAAGTGVNAAGKMSQAAGKGLDRSGKMLRQAGKNANDNRVLTRGPSAKKIADLRKVVNLRKSIKGHVKATRVNMTVLSVATPIWFTVQLPIALGAIVALGLAGIGEEIALQIMGSPVTSLLYSGFDAITNGIESVTGVNLNLLENWSGFSKVLFGALNMLVFLIGMITLFAMAVMYILSGVHCFFGEHAGFKIAAFILAMLFYLMPVLNIFPWFMLWGAVVWCYPK